MVWQPYRLPLHCARLGKHVITKSQFVKKTDRSIYTICEGLERDKNYLTIMWTCPKRIVDFEINNYVFREVFSIHDVIQSGIKNKLVLKCVENILRREAFLFVWLILAWHSKFWGQNSFKEGRMWKLPLLSGQ